MKIRVLSIYASPTMNADAGDVITLPDKEADDLIKAGYAVKLTASAAMENAKARKGENAMIPTGDSPEQDAQKLSVIADELEKEAKEAHYGFRKKAIEKAKAAREAADKARKKADELKAAGKK